MSELPTPVDDGLAIPTVGSWSRQKHHFLQRYIVAFTTAMRSKPWSGLHYIDLFAGAGIARVEGGGLIWGSPLIAAQVQHRFQQLHLCERDPEHHRALVARLQRFPQPSEPQVLCGDANELAPQVAAAVPERALSLAFLDPYGLHLHFETLRSLAQKRADLIIFFPDHLDALRNWEAYYFDQPNSNLDRVLGSPDWRPLMQGAARDKQAEVLSAYYVARIGSLGYDHFAHQRITRDDGRHLYKLIFCSRHTRGVEIWRNIAQKEAGGQYTFGFE